MVSRLGVLCALAGLAVGIVLLVQHPAIFNEYAVVTVIDTVTALVFAYVRFRFSTVNAVRDIAPMLDLAIILMCLVAGFSTCILLEQSLDVAYVLTIAYIAIVYSLAYLLNILTRALADRRRGRA